MKKENKKRIDMYITNRQNKFLIKESSKLEISKSEFIRKIIEEKIGKLNENKV